jgi:hypothetical protein
MNFILELWPSAPLSSLELFFLGGGAAHNALWAVIKGTPDESFVVTLSSMTIDDTGFVSSIVF